MSGGLAAGETILRLALMVMPPRVWLRLHRRQMTIGGIPRTYSRHGLRRYAGMTWRAGVR